MKVEIPSLLLNIAHSIDKAGGRSVLVGGFVRNLFLKIPTKDYDVEVYGIKSLDELKNILEKFGKVSIVGKFFAVLKFRKKDFEADFSFPRTESKIGKGHKGFKVNPNPNLSYLEAASRRDFTINSMGIDILSQEIYDPFSGQKDLRQRTLKHIGPSFSEDPLRVLRAVQFAARFGLRIDNKTKDLCKKCDLMELPKERIFEEFKKLLLKAEKPSIGLNYMRELKILSLFPELESLIGIPQDPGWHPEGDVWVHTIRTADEIVKLIDKEDERKDLVLTLSALCHDFGKPATTRLIDNRWRSYGHEKAALEPVRTFLARLTNETGLYEDIVPLVENHLKPALLYKADFINRVKDSAIRRLAVKVNIKDLVKVAKADYFAKTLTEKEKHFVAGDWLLTRACQLKVKDKAPVPILKGRHLLSFGIDPGPEMGKILDKSFEMQLTGEISNLEQALAWFKKQYVTIIQ